MPFHQTEKSTQGHRQHKVGWCVGEQGYGFAVLAEHKSPTLTTRTSDLPLDYDTIPYDIETAATRKTKAANATAGPFFRQGR